MNEVQTWLAAIEADITALYGFRDWLEENGKLHESVSNFAEAMKTATKIWKGFGKWLGCMNATHIVYLDLEYNDLAYFNGYMRERTKRDKEKYIKKMCKAIPEMSLIK